MEQIFHLFCFLIKLSSFFLPLQPPYKNNMNLKPVKFSKRKKKLPVLLVCRNCGVHVYGRYCHVCGQDLFAGRKRSVWDIIFGFFDSILSWDHKLWATLKLLLFFPGKLTKEYTSGHVVRFVHPSKLFWFV